MINFVFLANNVPQKFLQIFFGKNSKKYFTQKQKGVILLLSGHSYAKTAGYLKNSLRDFQVASAIKQNQEDEMAIIQLKSGFLKIYFDSDYF